MGGVGSLERAEADETDTFAARAGQLSPQKRRLLEQRLRARTSDVTAISMIPRRPADEPRRLSAAQKPLLLLHEANEDFVAYNVAQAHRIIGPLDLPALRAAIDDLYARHEVLRSKFSVRDGEPSVDVAPAGSCDVTVTDVAAADVSDFVSTA